MGLCQATSYVLLMTSTSQGKDTSEFGKLVTLSACNRVTKVYRTTYGSSGLQMGRSSKEPGPE